MTDKKLSKFLGCLYGGAIGDALGYPVEFRGAADIFNIYGPWGIEKYELFHGKAYISDDTQMTLFTAWGLLKGYTRACLRGIMGPWQGYVEKAYRYWLKTQEEKTREYQNSDASGSCWLLNVPELFNRRAPGNTCISALHEEKCGSVANPINNSKGCGGVMRVAPVGLYLPYHVAEIEKIDMIGAEIAALTHGHPLGYIPAAALVHIIAKCVTTDDSLEVIVMDAVHTMQKLFADKPHIDEFVAIMEKAVDLSHTELSNLDAMRQLGEGWVAEETLAIAVFCALRYQDDFKQAVVVSVNHDGDSDSTGAVTGNILGAYLGIDKIPNQYIADLELKEVIEEIAKDLFYDCRMSEYSKEKDEVWLAKYVHGTYRILHIAVIPYETGEKHYVYSRKLSADGTKWIRDGHFAEYYQNGNLASEGTYEDGFEEGYWKDYHENGNLAAEGYYSKGEEKGKWRFYNEQGELEEEEIYE